MYAPLWCKSSFSFLEGASHAEELVEEASRLGVGAFALTDRDGVYAMVRAHTKARELGLQLLCGAQLTVAPPGVALASSPVSLHHDDGRGPGWGIAEDGPAPPAGGRRARARKAKPRQPTLDLDAPAADPTAAANANAAAAPTAPSRLVLLAIDRAGWANLVRLITAGRRRCDKGDSLVGWDEVCARAGGLIALWHDALAGELAPPPAVVGSLRDAFGDRLYAMVARHRRAGDVAAEARLRARAAAAGLPVVAATEVLYHTRARRPLQDVMTCMRHRVTLATAGRRIHDNAEHDLRAPHVFAKLFADDAAAVARTLEVAARCTFSLAELRYRYPSERLPSGATSADYLRELTYRGAADRYGGAATIPADVRAQVDSELALIVELDYPGYFLTMYEIVSYCRRRGILCQGRGSAANSAVCYCLGITAVDPVRQGLLFERFLSRERAEPPDIDLDIEHERREEVIQHVYSVYGRDHAAMVCNVIRYRSRSSVRDAGKALGVPETTLDRAAKHMSRYGTVDPDALERAGIGDHGPVFQHLARISDELVEHPRHLSVHPGGFLLGHEPVHDIVPIENASMPGRTVIQWDKDDLEDLGLFKVDLLGLGALHQIHLAFDLIREHRGVELTMATVPAEDKATYDMICTADTVGTFQIESRAQMSMLPRLLPRTFYDLVIEVSLVRPGPISGGMVHPYLRRRKGLEPVVFPHPCLAPVLGKTLGVPLFQEQVMRLAIVAADYTPGEADQLRRDMAAWRRSGRIDKHRERLVERMAAKGIARDFAERVFEQIRGFGEYGFPESHATSFALIAYVTSWLRRHHLAEFTCSLLDAQPMGFYAPATIVGDARRHGLEIRPIDVAASNWQCSLEPPERADDPHGFAVRMGLRWIHGITHPEAERVVAARAARPFAGVEDFVRRADISRRTHTTLAEAGALGTLAPERRDALWQVAGYVQRTGDDFSLRGAADDVRFAPLGDLDEIFWDYQTSDHSVRGHPLGPLRGELRARGWPDARTVARGRDGQRLDYVGIVICRQQPGTAAGVTFMTLEDETGFVNLVVWPQVFEQYVTVARTQSLLGISGRLQVQEGIVHLIADRLWVPTLSTAIADVDSRDFH
jgi:error-prone DNA polymerase|nr:error-prone DNA polymerase [Kofleriaceae bacterium]